MKTQELGSGKNTLQDYSYGKPMLDMLVSQPIMDSVQVGKVTHKLKVGGNDQFEVYDYRATTASGTRRWETSRPVPV